MNPVKSRFKKLAPGVYGKLQEMRSQRLLRVVTARILAASISSACWSSKWQLLSSGR